MYLGWGNRDDMKWQRSVFGIYFAIEVKSGSKIKKEYFH